MKKLMFMLLMFCSAPVWAQKTADARAVAARTRMMEAFGGETALKKLKSFSYTIERTSYQNDTTLKTYTDYELAVQDGFIRITAHSPTASVIKALTTDGAWLVEGEKRVALPDNEKARLQSTFFSNFIPMLLNDRLQFNFVKLTEYKGHAADVVRVSDPESPSLHLDLFISKENGQVLTSSRFDSTNADNYAYYADELEYVPIGKGIIFPLVYKVYVADKLVSEGRFTNLVLKE